MGWGGGVLMTRGKITPLNRDMVLESAEEVISELDTSLVYDRMKIMTRIGIVYETKRGRKFSRGDIPTRRLTGFLGMSFYKDRGWFPCVRKIQTKIKLNGEYIKEERGCLIWRGKDE